MMLAVGLLLHLFVVEAWLVPEGAEGEEDERLAASVEPNLRGGDRVLVLRRTVPRPGQLARCVSPSDPSRFVVGRVFGREGDVVDVRGENSFVNGKVLHARQSCTPRMVTEPKTGRGVELSCAWFESGGTGYAVLSSRSAAPSASSVPVRVESGTLYLASDNRYLHEDSRDFGLVDASSCAPVVVRLWGASPFDEARRFDRLW